MRIVMVLAWVIAALYGLPSLLAYDLFETEEDGQLVYFCVNLSGMRVDILITVNFVMWYCIPLMLMTAMYSKIALKLWRSSLLHQVTVNVKKAKTMEFESYRNVSSSGMESSVINQGSLVRLNLDKDLTMLSMNMNGGVKYHINRDKRAILITGNKDSEQKQATVRRSQFRNTKYNYTRGNSRDTQNCTWISQSSERCSSMANEHTISEEILAQSCHDLSTGCDANYHNGNIRHANYDNSPIRILKKTNSWDGAVPSKKCMESTYSQSFDNTSLSFQKFIPDTYTRPKADALFAKFCAMKRNDNSIITKTVKKTYSRNNLLISRRKVIRLLLCIVISFAACMLPHHVRVLYGTWSGTFHPSYGYRLIPPISFLLFYLNSCLNPILYAFMSDNFRKVLWQPLLSVDHRSKKKSMKRDSFRLGKLHRPSVYMQ